jgi:hypothetical protein
MVKRTGEHVQKWRNKTKSILIKCLGGKCNRCGYNICYRSLHFHHLKDKKFNIAGALCRPKNISDMLEEIKKCILLCGNCHGELHSKLWSIEDINLMNFDEKIYNEYLESLNINCPCGNVFTMNSKQRKYCSKKCLFITKGKTNLSKHNRFCLFCYEKFNPKDFNQEFCSVECSAKIRRKVSRPTKEELEILIWKKPTIRIAKDFGVSDQAVAKWCRLYGISKPPRGYWAKPENDLTKQEIMIE